MKYKLILAACALLALHETRPAPAFAAAPAAAALPSAPVRLPHISIRSIGRGDPVVLIPGLASPAAVWDGIAPELAKTHRVILVEINGFGGGDPGGNGAPGLLAGTISDLAGWLAANHVERPAVIGHSMGGLIGMMLVRDHPERVGRLMIVDSLPFFGVLMGPGATVDSVRPMAAQMRDSIRDAAAPGDAPPNMSNSPAGVAQVTAWMHAADRKVVAEGLYEDLESDLRSDVPKFGARPLTIVYAVPSAQSAAMVTKIYTDAYAAAPGAKLVPVENSYHFIMLDQPARFRAAVEDFIGGK
ncbi:MAG TPA: alpha/beta hydrolase [Allosphingosinicella sp.]|jgi:pimeloyl-ACP methyl ester carboxylesterase